jgi:hypothetical protein
MVKVGTGTNTRYAQSWYKCVPMQSRCSFFTIPVSGPISRAVGNKLENEFSVSSIEFKVHSSGSGRIMNVTNLHGVLG